MEKKTLIGTCVDNPFREMEKLEKIIDEAKKISKRTFFKRCEIALEIEEDIKRFPNDYEFYKYQEIYFYRWSAIEHFYK